MARPLSPFNSHYGLNGSYFGLFDTLDLPLPVGRDGHEPLHCIGIVFGPTTWVHGIFLAAYIVF